MDDDGKRLFWILVGIIILIILLVIIKIIVLPKIKKFKKLVLCLSVIISIIISIAVVPVGEIISEVILEPVSDPPPPIKTYIIPINFDINKPYTVDENNKNYQLDMSVVRKLHKNYINSLTPQKTETAKNFTSDSEEWSFMQERDDISLTKEKRVESSKKLVFAHTKNSEFIETHALLLQDLAIEMYEADHEDTVDCLLEAISYNLQLLSFTEDSINESNAYYRIGQLYEYLSMVETSERSIYVDRLSSAVFFEFAYENSAFYGDAYSQNAMLLHRIIQTYGYDNDLAELAITNYKIAIQQKCYNVETCKNSIKQLNEMQTYEDE